MLNDSPACAHEFSGETIWAGSLMRGEVLDNIPDHLQTEGPVQVLQVAGLDEGHEVDGVLAARGSPQQSLEVLERSLGHLILGRADVAVVGNAVDAGFLPTVGALPVEEGGVWCGRGRQGPGS